MDCPAELAFEGEHHKGFNEAARQPRYCCSSCWRRSQTISQTTTNSNFGTCSQCTLRVSSATAAAAT
jgi:hypothetical protein